MSLNCLPFLGLVVLLGCAPPTSPPPPAPAPGPAPAAVPAPTPATAAATRETWDVLLMSGHPVGYTHTVTTPSGDVVEIQSTSVLQVKRFGDTAKQRLLLTSVETPAGEVRRFESRMSMGPLESVTRGTCERDRLTLEISTQGKVSQAAFDWRPEYGGFFATEKSLERRPLQVGEERTLRAFVPILNQIANSTLKAVRRETVELPSGSRSLLRIEQTTKVGEQTLRAVVWCDEQGQTWKSEMSELGQVSFRTTREEALRPVETRFDLGLATTVRLARPLVRPEALRRVTYWVKLKHANPREVFVQDGTQSVESVDDRTARISVRSVRPGESPVGPPSAMNKEAEPGPGDSSPNNLIQSDDPAVRELAQQVAATETDAWKIGCALEAHVKSRITQKDFTQAFATAAEVAQSLQGDCTEHAVLLAALLRARRIPARVAIGLVNTDAGRAFAYHMWTEAWIAERWIPLDATIGRGGIGGGHIKILTSNLQGADAYSAFLPVVRVLGQLELEVEASE